MKNTSFSFRRWLAENDSQKEQMLRHAWNQIFDKLEISGIGKKNALQYSLSQLEVDGGQRGVASRGKAAVAKKLKDVFDVMRSIQDPDIQKNVDNAEYWLNSDKGANASTTLKTLLEKLFGQETFEKFLVSPDKTPSLPKQPSQPIADVPDQPPGPAIQPQDAGMPPSTGMLGDQPPPNGQLPQRPAGADLGLF